MLSREIKKSDEQKKSFQNYLIHRQARTGQPGYQDYPGGHLYISMYKSSLFQ